MDRLYGYFRSAVFLFPIFAGVVAYSHYAIAPWGPVVGSAFACFAVSIGVQQFFAFLSDWRDPKQYVFLYSSFTLILFGVGVVLACVPNMSQLQLSPWAQHLLLGLSIFFISAGLIPLLRFGATSSACAAAWSSTPEVPHRLAKGMRLRAGARIGWRGTLDDAVGRGFSGRRGHAGAGGATRITMLHVGLKNVGPEIYLGRQHLLLVDACHDILLSRGLLLLPKQA